MEARRLPKTTTPERAPRRWLTRAVIAVMIVTVATAAAVYLVRQRLIAVLEPGPAAKAASEAMVVERIHQSATRDGRTEWNLEAESAQYLLSEKKVLLQNLFVTFFTRDGQKVYLTARNGTVKTDSHDMEARNEVVVYNDLYRLETEQMNYAQESRQITSDTPVKITGQAGEIAADTLAVDLNTNRLVMRGHVRGTLSSPEAQGASPRGPLRIQSEELTADMNADTAEFIGRVRVEDDLSTTTADRLRVHFKPGTDGQHRMAGAASAKDISRMVARGRVVVRTQNLTAGGDAGEYEPDTGRAALWGEKSAAPRPAAAPNSAGAGGAPERTDTAHERVRVVVAPSAERR
jgi:LPS export ABC transporter protein LptC